MIPPHFSHTKGKRGGTFRNITNNKYLTEDQAKLEYKKVNTGKAIDNKAIKTRNGTRKLVGTEDRKYIPKSHIN